MLFVKPKDPKTKIHTNSNDRERWPWTGFAAWDTTMASGGPQVLFDAKALGSATTRLVTTTVSFGWIAGTEPAPLSFRVPPQFDSRCGMALVAMKRAPRLCQLAQVDPARFKAHMDSFAEYTAIAHSGARARADGLAALRVNEDLGTHLVTETLEWLHGVCYPATGPADYGKIGVILDDFAPFLRGVNKEVMAPQKRREDHARRVAALAEEQRRVDAKLKATEVEGKLQRGETVSNDDILAAAQAEVSKPPAKGRRQSGRQSGRR